MDVFFATLTLIILVAFAGYNTGSYGQKSITREETVIFCNQKPVECKKEFKYYQLKREIETMKEDQK